MPRRPRTLGPHTYRLIEESPIEVARATIEFHEDGDEPRFDLPPVDVDPTDEETLYEAREALIHALSLSDPDDLHPLEHRCERIYTLADGKGVASLETVVEQQLNGDSHEEFERQPDSLCRSAWVFLKAAETFEDAESFHYVRQFRDHGKLYDAFEVDLENAIDLHAESIDKRILAQAVTEALALKTRCTVRALDLPPTATHPASIMLVVRHGGPLSSVHDHRDDGRKGIIYFRPSNEATLIYTPAMRQIEVCANSPVVRQKVGGCFAQVALGHNVSKKPLTWKRYNLLRFRESFELPLPQIEGFELHTAHVLEAEIQLGSWRRKLRLKVADGDSIEEVADLYLEPHNIFRRADQFSRIAIAVCYNRAGEEKRRSFNITVSGEKSCNLQSNKDPEQRGLGFALLDAWGIMSAFKQIEAGDLQAMFAQLLQLHDCAEKEVSGRHLRELGLPLPELIAGGLLERRGRQDFVLSDEEGVDGEMSIVPSARPGMVRVVGPFGEDMGERSIADLEVFRINREWLHETLIGLLKPLLSKQTLRVLDDRLTLLGSMPIDGAQVPVYFAHGLENPKTIDALDIMMRARQTPGAGIVLAAGSNCPGFLGPNVVVPLPSLLAQDQEDGTLCCESIETAFRSGRALALGGATPQLLKAEGQTASLHIPGKPPLSLVGANQIRIFERLLARHKSGVPDAKAAELLEGLGVRSPQNAFRTSMWNSIVNVYIGKGAKNGYWRLITD